ncbi:putative late blight resistance protein-like R1B-11 [Vitis vinifera]|uniref:Putative late blight resistance protein-like R1B-11 n=1 Tax=Vitis vinifera TaxID=29760 RepID=A0A438JLV0_VITVI|nr:putative late blight resistance protein-like R1B-11 [Vitis vinifera]
MAEGTVTLLCGEVSNLILQEASVFGQVEGQIKLLRNELEWMRPLPEGCGFKAHIRRKNQAWLPAHPRLIRLPAHKEKRPPVVEESDVVGSKMARGGEADADEGRDAEISGVYRGDGRPRQDNSRQEVYNQRDVQQHFDLKKKRDERSELGEKLCEYLKEKKYLVVMDDVWSSEVWSRLRSHLPEAKDGSKVLITTRGSWEKVLASIEWYLDQGPESCMGILALSYNDLSYYLKSCFLYCGIFPEDSEIEASKLIRLWLAEGFIQRRGKETLEGIAEDYMHELIHRSLIQVAERRVDGGVESCRMHDLLRDLAVLEAKDAKFFEVHENIDFTFPISVRRLVIHQIS